MNDSQLPSTWLTPGRSIDTWPQLGQRIADDGHEFDYLYQRLGDGVYLLCLHPQCIGRGSRMLMLERLIDRMASANGVQFRTMEDVAADFRKASR